MQARRNGLANAMQPAGAAWAVMTAKGGRTRKEPSMNSRPQGHVRRAALLVTAVALSALPGSATAARDDGTNSLLRNDTAHYWLSDAQGATLREATPSAPSREAVVVRVEGGFDWMAAGVGAAGLLGFMLVVGGAASVMRLKKRVA